MLTRRRIHALLIIDGLGWGGAEMLLPEFVRAAASIDIDVSVAYLREKDGSPAAARLREVGVEPIGLDIGGLLDPRSLRRVRHHIAAVSPDIVHTHLGYSDFLGGIAAGLLDIPVVSTIHVTMWDGSSRDRVKTFLFGQVRRHVANRVIAVSDAARSTYLSHGWGPRDRVVTIHNGISGTARPGAGRAIRTELGLGANDLVVGMLSVLRQGKGHDIAIDAVTRLQPRFPHLRLLVIGEGPARREIEALITPLGEAVVLAGHRDDVMEVLDAVDVLVLPTHHEAFPTALLDAMAASVPVVATAVGGVLEIVVGGVTGSLVPSPPRGTSVADAMLELLKEPEMRACAGLAGRRRFEEEFTLEHWARRMRRLYEQVIDEGPRLDRRSRRDGDGT